MKMLRQILWQLFNGCGHKEVAFPQRGYQRCLACGARRSYKFGANGIFKGEWQPAELPRFEIAKVRKTIPERRSVTEVAPVA